MICGLIRSGKSHLKDLGTEFPELIHLESRVKKVKRWLQNKHTSWESHFLPSISAILARSIANEEEIVFAIDGSEVGQGCTALMISLVVGKRAIPVVWLVRKCKKGHLPASMHLELFTRLHQILDGYEHVVVLGDGEFDNHQVIEACEDWNWNFVFRTAKSTYIFDGRDEYKIGYLEPSFGDRFFTVNDVFYTKKRHGVVQVTAWRERKWKQCIFLLSNFELSYQAACFYRKRWSIETLFSDLKTRGFNIHKSMLNEPKRLVKLLIIACLAYILVFQLGLNEQNSILIPFITRKDRMDLSAFALGLKLIRYCDKHRIKIIFSFSKKSGIQI
jgi:hypothetical protein